MANRSIDASLYSPFIRQVEECVLNIHISMRNNNKLRCQQQPTFLTERIALLDATANEFKTHSDEDENFEKPVRYRPRGPHWVLFALRKFGSTNWTRFETEKGPSGLGKLRKVFGFLTLIQVTSPNRLTNILEYMLCRFIGN